MTKEEKKAYMKIWRKNNKDKKAIHDKTYHEKHREKILAKSKENREKNGEEINKKHKEYFDKNPEAKAKKLKRNRDYFQKNKTEIIQKRKKKREENPLYRMTCITRSLIHNAFNRKGYKKTSKTHEILGCTYEEFKIYIESKFESWMNWDNKGLYNGQPNHGWDIDHIIPICTAITVEDVIRLNHYSNLQPLCSKVNRDIKKGLIIN